MDADIWGAKMTPINWKYVLGMGKGLNGEEHGKYAVTIHKKKKEILMRKRRY